MIRAVLPSVLLFLLPFALYLLWAGIQRRRSDAAAVEAAPYRWIALAGLVLALAGFLYFMDLTAAAPDGVYVPPRYEDGRVVPGHFAPHKAPGL
jgi:Co/Zn/Cd efflux system component